MSRPESELPNTNRFPLQQNKETRTSSVQFRVQEVNRTEAIQRFDTETQIEAGISRGEAVGKASVVHPRESEWMQNAIRMIENNEHSMGQSLIREVLRGNSKQDLAIYWLGKSLLAQGKLGEAQRCFQEAVHIRNKAEYHFELAEILYTSGFDQDALKAYFRCLKALDFESPMLFHIYKNIGNIFVRAGDLDAAEENYNKAFALNPDSDAILVNYGTLEIQRGRLDRALERFRQSVERNAENDKAWVGLAIIHREYGDFELSWGNLERALDINAANEAALNLIVDWAVKDNRVNSAIQRVENYLCDHDQDANMGMVLARLLAGSGRYPMALLELEKVLAQEPCIDGGAELLDYLKTEMQKQRGSLTC